MLSPSAFRFVGTYGLEVGNVVRSMYVYKTSRTELTSAVRHSENFQSVTINFQPNDIF
jgi:hypothetical protein